MTNTTKTPFAALLALALTTAPVQADTVRVNTEIPGMGTVTLVIDTSTAQPRPADTGTAQALQAVDFAARLLRDWSRPGFEGASALSHRYAPWVRFYGAMRSAASISEERFAMAARWPVREYRVVPASVNATCTTECVVTANYSFVAYNPATGERSAGLSTLHLVLEYTPGGFQIVEEGGVVYSRG